MPVIQSLKHKFFTAKWLIAFFACVCFCDLSFADNVYDVNDILVATNNPNGAWSYGDETNMGGPLALYAATQSEADFEGVYGFIFYNPTIPDAWNTPLVGGNVTDDYQTNFTVINQPYQISFHPGPHGELSVFRFTAPIAGNYQLNCAFQGIDYTGLNSVGVHVLYNDVSMFDANVRGYGEINGTNFATNLVLALGDRVDFAVGDGPEGNSGYGTTGITATLNGLSDAQPPPANQPPTLAISFVNGNMQLNWSTNCCGYILESCHEFCSTNWTAATNVPCIVGDQFIVTNPCDCNKRFFRLHQQP